MGKIDMCAVVDLIKYHQINVSQYDNIFVKLDLLNIARPKPLIWCRSDTEQDSKELSPRSLDKMLLKRQVNSQNVQSTQLSKFFKFSKSELL